MRFLLDTHALLWVLTDRSRLTPKIEKLIDDPGNEVWASAASIYEVAAKSSAGRRRGVGVDGEQFLALTRRAHYDLLSVSPEHAAAVSTIAIYHGDPFDRLLLAQAKIEGLQLVTHDEALAQYDSRTVLF